MTCREASRTSLVDFGATGLLGLVRRRVAITSRYVVVWARRRRQRQQLKDLDDHLLRDIGISRAQADREMRKPFWS